jgi:hypothetical protein
MYLPHFQDGLILHILQAVKDSLGWRFFAHPV